MISHLSLLHVPGNALGLSTPALMTHAGIADQLWRFSLALSIASASVAWSPLSPPPP